MDLPGAAFVFSTGLVLASTTIMLANFAALRAALLAVNGRDATNGVAIICVNAKWACGGWMRKQFMEQTRIARGQRLLGEEAVAPTHTMICREQHQRITRESTGPVRSLHEKRPACLMCPRQTDAAKFIGCQAHNRINTQRIISHTYDKAKAASASSHVPWASGAAAAAS